MTTGHLKDEIVLFHLTTRERAERFMRDVASERLSTLQEDEFDVLVGILLGPDPDDLAHLLRDVQDWLDVSCCDLIPYELDGRSYYLTAR